MSTPVASPANPSLDGRIMTGAEVSRLPLRRIEAALHMTTETLANELASPSETAPEWTAFEWSIARAAAAMHGVSPLLSNTLRWRGPEAWEQFLREQKIHTLTRHERIALLLKDIGSRAARDGIAVVPLKGAALHELGIYRPGERPMSDIDLLVRGADVKATTELLNTCGYQPTYTTWKHWVFESDTKGDYSSVGEGCIGEHAQSPIKIELHSRVAERLPIVDRDVTARVFPPQPTAGLNGYPSIAALMLHMLTHAAGAMCSNALRLLHLHDIALLSRRMTASDWEELFSGSDGQVAWWISPPLQLTARYYATAIPGAITARAEANCPRLLRQIFRRRTLSSVSLSNLRIQAFPGVEWSQSPREAFTHMIGRVKPDRTVLLGRQETLRLHPHMAHFSWSHLSQGRRMIHWLLNRPPRVETLSPICTVLAETYPAALSTRYKRRSSSASTRWIDSPSALQSPTGVASDADGDHSAM